VHERARREAQLRGTVSVTGIGFGDYEAHVDYKVRVSINILIFAIYLGHSQWIGARAVRNNNMPTG